MGWLREFSPFIIILLPLPKNSIFSISAKYFSGLRIILFSEETISLFFVRKIIFLLSGETKKSLMFSL